MTDEALQEILCCIGYPVAGNPAQYVMEKAMADADLDLRYLTLEVSPENLGDAARGMRAMGFLGGHITDPHKSAILQYLDEVTDAARLTGLVSMVYRNDEGLYIGENTDGKGFLESLKEVTEPEEKKVVILGSGTTARAVAVEMGLAGATSLAIVSRSEENGKELSRMLSETGNFSSEFIPFKGDIAIPEGTDILVNATTIGQNDSNAEIPIDLDTLDPATIVADVVFNPPETWLIRTAAEHGCRTLDGLDMLINQGALAFHTWTALWPNKVLMREAVEEFLLL